MCNTIKQTLKSVPLQCFLQVSIVPGKQLNRNTLVDALEHELDNISNNKPGLNQGIVEIKIYSFKAK